MDIAVEKIPGGMKVDGLELKNGKCGCTSVLPCCYIWSKIKRSMGQDSKTCLQTGNALSVKPAKMPLKKSDRLKDSGY